MELGNFFFGNSRGDYPLERGKWQNEFSRIFELSKLDVYTAFENEVFSIFPYYWGECTCGNANAIDKFEEEYNHSADCFLTKVTEFENSLEANGVKRCSPEWYNRVEAFVVASGLEGCTCGFEEKYDKFVEEHPHTAECLLVKPNFLYKPTGYEINWYKYPLRDSYANKKLSFRQFSEMVDACIKSLKKPRKKREKKIA
jgi:hypothetical protein